MKSVKKKFDFIRILSALTNPWLWHLVWCRILQFFFPSNYRPIKIMDPPPDAKLISLDGKKGYSLVKDFVEPLSPDLPLIVNVGSYN
jgi:hypothetical protein